MRSAAASAALGAVSRFGKRRIVRSPNPGGGYGATLHRDFAGEFDYDLEWKPVGASP